MKYITDIIIGKSVSAAVMILLIIFLRRIFFNKISAKALAVMWLLPVIKLLAFYERNVYVSVENVYLSDGGAYIQTAERYAEQPFFDVMTLDIEIPYFLRYVWLFGAVFTGALYIFEHIVFLRGFSCALPCCHDITELKKSFDIKRKVILKISDMTDAPFTYGIFRPVVILPKMPYDNNDGCLNNILCHELAHIKRNDTAFRAILALCTALYWFDPFVWAMMIIAVRDTELACDETAIKKGKVSPADYALALIGMEERRCFPRTAGFTGGSPEERITEIMKSKKTSPITTAAAMIISVMTAVSVNFSVVSTTAEEIYLCYEGTAECEAYREYEISIAENDELVVSNEEFSELVVLVRSEEVL